MNQDEGFSFSELRRKREEAQSRAPIPPAAGPAGYQPRNPMDEGHHHFSHPNPPRHFAAPGAAGGPGFGIQDAYFILFRHKWKIIGLFLASVIGAAVFYFGRSTPYQSEAKVLVRYILESSSAPMAVGESGSGGPIVKSVDDRGDNIINSEIQILTSADLALRVAEKVGPEKILAEHQAAGDGHDKVRAAQVINSGLFVEAPMRGSVLRLVFRHSDPTVVQPVLKTLIETYLSRSVEIHLGVGAMDDFFMRQADQLRTRLAQTEQELRKLKADAEIISLEDSKQAYVQVIGRIQNELLSAEAELAERRAALEILRQDGPTNAGKTNLIADTIPAEVYERHRRNAADLKALRDRLAELKTRYTDQHFQVRNLNSQIAAAEADRDKLVAEFPVLAELAITAPVGTNQLADLRSEIMRVNALTARAETLKTQLEKARSGAGRVADIEPVIVQLERARAVDELNYRYYKTKLEHAQLDESFGAGNIPNISVVQNPTPPARGGKSALKPVLMIILFGCVAGFAWGFVSDRILSPTINQVADLERQLPFPLFISVPDMEWNGKEVGKKRRFRGKREAGVATPDAASPASGNTDDAEKPVGPWDPAHVMRPYYEGLRDRLVTYFEVRNMNYKPKMVAITSCNHGSGVTTMAAGLAAALSETGDGKVLLVDMNLERGAAHPFFQGKPSGALTDALETATREPAMVNDNLYLVSACDTEAEPKNQKLPSVLPKRFTHLVPKMKASDYDYIIFDMPPVTQTSFTARLAGYMDMVLLVVESEKTGQGILKRTRDLLNESRPNMAAILNKHRAYVPPKLSQEL